MTIPVDNASLANPERPAALALTGPIKLTPFKDPLKIPPVLHPRRLGALSFANINMRVASVKLHSELPPTKLWTYDECFPGPTIVVQRGERVRISFTNQLSGTSPLIGVQAGSVAEILEPGRSGGKVDERVEQLVPWNVVHLHGARTGAGNDGWPENGMLAPDAQLCEHANDQESTLLWYHDHAMAVTRLNVASGLAGLYIIRDEQEDRLNLPHGVREVPLMLADRNLDLNDDGTLNGQVLHKIALLDAKTGLTSTYVAPFNLVNGVITPHLDVSSAWYRFRVVNAANGRIYKLRLSEGGVQIKGAIKQIGSDGGLLPAPVTLDELTLAPAERADLLIDFSAFKGRRLQLRNFGPRTVNADGDDVMEFRVSHFPAIDPFVLPAKLSNTFVRYGHDNGTIPKSHGHRWVVLTPVQLGHPQLWEMEEVKPEQVQPGETGIVQVEDVIRDSAGNELSRTLYTLRRVAERFSDTLSFRVKEGDFEVWNFVHLGSDVLTTLPDPMHPLHIHLVQFQALSRIKGTVLEAGPTQKLVFGDHDVTVDGKTVKVRGTAHPVEFVRSSKTDEGTLLPNEIGWKDVIRVDAGTWVRVAAKFEGAHGRFVYHCHMLEHEDEGMMRPFTVMPASVAALDVEHTGHHPHS